MQSLNCIIFLFIQFSCFDEGRLLLLETMRLYHAWGCSCYDRQQARYAPDLLYAFSMMMISQVEPRELTAWVNLATRCFKEMNDIPAAAQLSVFSNNFKEAKDVLQRKEDYSSLAVICQRAFKHYNMQAKLAKIRAATARSQTLLDGRILGASLTDNRAAAAAQHVESMAVDHERTANKNANIARMYLARTCYAHFKEGKLSNHFHTKTSTSRRPI